MLIEPNQIWFFFFSTIIKAKSYLLYKTILKYGISLTHAIDR